LEPPELVNQRAEALHVLQVSPYFPPTWAYGGIPRIVYGLGKGLLARGVKTSVWTTDAFDAKNRSPKDFHHQLEGLNIWVSKNLSNHLAYEHQLFLPQNARQILDEIQNVDLVHLHGHRHLLNNHAIAWANRRGIPWVFTPNGTLPRQERKLGTKIIWDRVVAAKAHKGAAACIAVSRAEVGQMLRVGISKDRIHQIPNGLMLEEFADLPPKGSFKEKWGITGPVVSYLGRISPRKGVEHLVAAFSGDGLPQATLVVAGNDMGALDLARSKADDRVIFTGLLEGRDRLALLVDSEVLVYPSSDEIFGLVPFEGLLCGTPAVVGGDCGCGQLIREAGAGLLVQHANVSELRDRIRVLLSDQVAAAAMVARGREYVLKNLSFEHVASAHEALYRQVLSQA
jgi:glycosyltransferase involved in cell wall biosynthesis